MSLDNYVEKFNEVWNASQKLYWVDRKSTIIQCLRLFLPSYTGTTKFIFPCYLLFVLRIYLSCFFLTTAYVHIVFDFAIELYNLKQKIAYPVNDRLLHLFTLFIYLINFFPCKRQIEDSFFLPLND